MDGRVYQTGRQVMALETAFLPFLTSLLLFRLVHAQCAPEATHCGIVHVDPGIRTILTTAKFTMGPRPKPRPRSLHGLDKLIACDCSRDD